MSIELLKEPKVGHTHARNCAIEHSMGDLVIWTDDDVCVRETWIQRYVDACESAPDVGFWGAAIRPVFPGGMPDWIEENWEACAGCFASRDLGAERIPLSQSTLPYGANFAVRGDVLRSHRFDINLGRRGDLILGEDELEYMRRLMDAGVRGEWVPDNALQHVIPSERATERYVWNYFLGQGLRLGMQGDRKDASWLHRMRHALGYHFRRNRSPSPVWFAHLACWGLAAGKAKASAYGS
jgi:GT2 family glycosyltransferase